MAQLSERGFSPIQLERYCGSNKIWSTKIKRLRLPDLLCVRTGMRIEVRAKSNLEIKMSDAPANPDRVWDAGLRDDDLIAFIAFLNILEEPTPADGAVYFTARSLRESINMSKVGPPKSASEGAERDRKWPAIVPKRSGKVLSVGREKVVVRVRASKESPERNQTYTLKGKTPYVRPGETFSACADILAGAPAALADLGDYASREYRPLDELLSQNDVDRYAAVKALRYRDENRDQTVAALEKVIEGEKDERVKLEAAGSAAFLGSNRGEDVIAAFIWDNEERADLRFEAVLVLTELVGNRFSHDALIRVATDEQFRNGEIRQAAVWGLGKSGLRAYEDLLSFINDDEENVALHAISAFGHDTPRSVIERLIADLISGSPSRAPAASEVLRTIENEDVYAALVEVGQTNPTDWVVATLGRLPPWRLREMLAGHPLVDKITPMLLLTDRDNWLARESIRTDIAFLLKQDL